MFSDGNYFENVSLSVFKVFAIFLGLLYNVPVHAESLYGSYFKSECKRGASVRTFHRDHLFVSETYRIRAVHENPYRMFI